MKRLLFLSLLFLAGVGQVAEYTPDHFSHTDSSGTFFMQYCDHDWQPSKYFLGGPSFIDHTGGGSTYYSGNMPVEVCSKCGLLRIKPERK